ncbi:cupin domain-containing protein [Algiphilus sp.]|uniref:cupin domain-containing protein n=1 Tax=Algiphilus sp. TaxID=1872431 RepID=UPI0025C149DC|nr:cupin domain-containing protein [Algiphilus sp.]MCK5769974.1 cupin domain-containing protein [Algiphilus sp.]
MNGRRIVIPILLLGAGSALAHDSDEHGVTPETERERARELRADGPQESRGIEGVDKLGSVSLAGEIPDDSDRVLRARELRIAPGGVVAVHRHQQRPGVAYILEGSIVEHRNDAAEPITRGPGAVAFERSGVTHWWENRSDTAVRALVVDIVPASESER